MVGLLFLRHAKKFGMGVQSLGLVGEFEIRDDAREGREIAEHIVEIGGELGMVGEEPSLLAVLQQHLIEQIVEGVDLSVLGDAIGGKEDLVKTVAHGMLHGLVSKQHVGALGDPAPKADDLKGGVAQLNGKAEAVGDHGEVGLLKKEG